MKRNRTKTRSSESEEEETSSGGAGWMKTGKAIEKEAERLKAENEQRAALRKRTGGLDPNKFRFWVKPGEEAEIVILDEEIDTVAFFEHGLKKDGKWGNYESCPGEWSNCPLCASGDHKAFVWFLTILDLTPYTKEDGTVVPYFRRLLPIKPTQANTYKRILKAAYKEHGTIRGIKLVVERDTADKSAAIGEPVILENGKMFDFMDEDELADEFGHAPIKAKNGDVLVKKNGLLHPYDYEAIFPKPDAKDIAKRWGLSDSAGSDSEYDKLKDEEDEPRAKKKAKSRREVDEDEDEDEEEETKVHPFLSIALVADAKGASRNKTLDAAAEHAGLEADDFNSWEDLAEELIALEAKPKAKKAAKKVAKKASRKVDEDEDEDEDEEDEAPVAKKRGKVSRRKLEDFDEDEDEDDIPF